MKWYMWVCFCVQEFFSYVNFGWDIYVEIYIGRIRYIVIGLWYCVHVFCWLVKISLGMLVMIGHI